MKKTKAFAFILATVLIFSAFSVVASASFLPYTADEISAIEGVNTRMALDFSTYTITDKNLVSDGGASTVTIYDTDGSTVKETISLPTSNFDAVKGIKRIKNVYYDADQTDGDFGKVVRLVAYRAGNDACFVGDDLIVTGETFYVIADENGDYEVVDKNTPGALKAVANINDDNNIIKKQIDGVIPLVSNTWVASMTFRYTGVSNVTLVTAIASKTTGSGNGSISFVGVSKNKNELSVGGTARAVLSNDRYYNLTCVFYAVTEEREGTKYYTIMGDVYLDGVKVGTAPLTGTTGTTVYTDVPEEKVNENTFGIKYLRFAQITPFYTNSDDELGDFKDVILVKQVQDYSVPTGTANAFKRQNSGNTIEGYDLTLASKLELNYYMNLLPETAKDPKAEVHFTIGDEVVATKKVSEVTPDAKGLYKFTCPVNSTQMAEDIKVCIESETKDYKIYMNSTPADDYTYSVSRYAKTILESSDAKYTEAKPVVKAMLNYGAAAQTYFAAKNGTTVGTLANVGYEFTAAELGAADFGTGTVTGATAGMTATLTLDTDTVIKIYKDGALVGTSEGITADKLNDDVTITVDGGSVKVSVLTVAGKVPAAKTEFRALAQALALYSAATETYIAG